MRAGRRSGGRPSCGSPRAVRAAVGRGEHPAGGRGAGTPRGPGHGGSESVGGDGSGVQRRVGDRDRHDEGQSAGQVDDRARDRRHRDAVDDGDLVRDERRRVEPRRRRRPRTAAPVPGHLHPVERDPPQPDPVHRGRRDVAGHRVRGQGADRRTHGLPVSFHRPEVTGSDVGAAAQPDESARGPEPAELVVAHARRDQVPAQHGGGRTVRRPRVGVHTPHRRRVPGAGEARHPSGCGRSRLTTGVERALWTTRPRRTSHTFLRPRTVCIGCEVAGTVCEVGGQLSRLGWWTGAAPAVTVIRDS
ncbi:hypothetical protein BG618_04744 [Pseudonocardia autotrophica]|nr:hypothetical protein BG618_04744 [Pseudonocardia autotrophica]